MATLDTLLKENHVDVRLKALPEARYFETHKQYSSTSARKGIHARAETYRWCSGTPPLGYKISLGGWLIVDESEASIIREVFAYYIYFESLLKTAQALNSAGIKTRARNTWNPNTVGDKLCNDIYIGNFRLAGVVKHLEALRIVSDETFNKVAVIRKRNFDWKHNKRATLHTANNRDIIQPNEHIKSSANIGQSKTAYYGRRKRRLQKKYRANSE